MSAYDWAGGKSGRMPQAPRKRGRAGSDVDASTQVIQRKESCACGGTCPSCQAKAEGLTVGRAGDASEVEADRVADRVVRGESVAGSVGDRAADGGIARTAKDSAAAAASSATSSEIRSSRGSGQALDAATRTTMSQRFGKDLSGVRVHADSRAAQLSEQLNARAFTVGNDIYFGRGRFDPSSTDGTRLLAHELTHVVQQGAGATELLQRSIDDESAEQSSEAMPAMADESAVDSAPAVGETESENAEPLKEGGRCRAESNRHYMLANYVDFEFTVPAGCTATVTFSALWVPYESAECCTGEDTYSVTRNGGRAQRMPAGPNICEGEHTPQQRAVTVNGGRQRFHVQVDRRNCDGIRMQLDVNIRIR